MPNTTRRDIARECAKRTGLSQIDCSIAVDVMLRYITRRLAHGDTVEFRGAMRFYTVSRAATMRRNPRTMAPVYVPEHRTAKVRWHRGVV